MTCDPDESARWAKTHRSGKLYARVSVAVTSVTTDPSSVTVTFSAKSKNATTGDPGVPDSIATTVNWDETNEDIWIQCPSTLPNPPAVGDTGTLYLEKALLATRDANGNVIQGTPKWPNALPAIPTRSLTVWPTSVIVEGYAILGGELYPGSVDLLDPTEALTIQDSNPAATTPPQRLALDGRAVTLSLTPNGFSDGCGLAFSISSLTSAVETIKRGASARAMAHAWRTIARWGDVLEARPDRLPAEAHSLLRQVIKRPAS